MLLGLEGLVSTLKVSTSSSSSSISASCTFVNRRWFCLCNSALTSFDKSVMLLACSCSHLSVAILMSSTTVGHKVVSM